MPNASNCSGLITTNPCPREHTYMSPRTPVMCRTVENRQTFEFGEVLTKLLILSEVL